jgi:hypothetical protein
VTKGGYESSITRSRRRLEAWDPAGNLSEPGELRESSWERVHDVAQSDETVLWKGLVSFGQFDESRKVAYHGLAHDVKDIMPFLGIVYAVYINQDAVTGSFIILVEIVEDLLAIDFAKDGDGERLR